MIKEQWKEKDDYQLIEFQNDSITLDIPRTPLKIVDNWRIVPQSPLRVCTCICFSFHLQYKNCLCTKFGVYCQIKKILE